MDISFHIAPTSGVPIYRQLMDQVRRMIASRRLSAGDALPSVRRLATELEVNPMTVSKAYSLLEAEGLLDRLRGKGMAVAEVTDARGSVRERLQLLRPVLENAADQSSQLELSKGQTLDFFEQILEERS